VSKHPTLLKNTGKMPWEKVQNVLLTYLKQVGVVFERSESLINPERRIHGVKVDNKMIQIVRSPGSTTNVRRLRSYRANGKTTNLEEGESSGV